MNAIPYARGRPRIPDAREAELAKLTQRYLASHAKSEADIKLKVDDEPDTVVLPAGAVRLLMDILGQIAQGNAVTLVPIHAELTTQQAADLMNVSRPYLIKLLEAGELGYHMVGSHRRIKAEDLFAYKDKLQAKSAAAQDEMARLSQDLGFGYD